MQLPDLKTARFDRRAYDAAWRARSRDKIREAGRKYYLTHKEECRRRNDAYEAKNKEKVAARKLKYRRDNALLIKARAAARMLAEPERFKRYRKNSYERNKAKISEYLRIHRAKTYERDKEKIAARGKSYRSRNPDKVRAANARRIRGKRTLESRKRYEKYPDKYRIAASIRRARKFNALVGNPKLIDDWIKSVRSRPRSTCFWCKVSAPSKSIHIDHIHALASGGAHEVGNLCVSCDPCNRRKQARSLTRWNASLLEPVLF